LYYVVFDFCSKIKIIQRNSTYLNSFVSYVVSKQISVVSLALEKPRNASLEEMAVRDARTN
jgi:hypothetical protein